MPRDHFDRQGRIPFAETAIGFLKCHDVGIDFTKNVEDTFRVTYAVKADGLSDVIACNSEHDMGLADWCAR